MLNQTCYYKILLRASHRSESVFFHFIAEAAANVYHFFCVSQNNDAICRVKLNLVLSLDVYNRHGRRCFDCDHPHAALLRRDVWRPQDALAHGVHPTVRQVLHHRRHRSRRRRTRRPAARSNPGAGVLRQGWLDYCDVWPI